MLLTTSILVMMLDDEYPWLRSLYDETTSLIFVPEILRPLFPLEPEGHKHSYLETRQS